MSRAIWKFEILVGDDETVIDVPQGGRIVHVACQGTILATVCVWIEVDPSKPVVGRRFCIVGTGHPIPEGGWGHVGTAIPHASGLVWHVYELTEMGQALAKMPPLSDRVDIVTYAAVDDPAADTVTTVDVRHVYEHKPVRDAALAHLSPDHVWAEGCC